MASQIASNPFWTVQHQCMMSPAFPGRKLTPKLQDYTDLQSTLLAPAATAAQCQAFTCACMGVSPVGAAVPRGLKGKTIAAAVPRGLKDKTIAW